MSFRQDFLRARLAGLPADVPGGADGAEDDEEEELDDFDVNGLGAAGSSSSSSSNNARDGFMRPRQPGNSGSSRSSGPSSDWTPQSGKGCFAQALQVEIGSSSSFRVYYTPPALSLGGGDHDDDDEGSPVVFVCHHGAGYSAMSFALLAQELVKESGGKAGVLAMDCRGHGKTTTPDDAALDIDTLAADLLAILKEVFPDQQSNPSLVLVGHSMGGSVVVKACASIQKEVGNVVGVVNLDVVEGTAMEALSSMMDIISTRPKGFNSLEEAIQWHVRSRTIGSAESARISVPPLFIEASNAESAGFRYVWRTNLAATQPFWEGWFSKLSSSFLTQRCAKLLVLAGAESLDKDLMIGQMQGRFQIGVFQDVGHCLQEEAPQRLAHLLLEFWRRNEQGRDQRKILKNVKKVGQV